MDYNNEAFEDSQDEDYNDQQQASVDDRKDKLLEEDYDEMAPDEVHEAEGFEQITQEEDPEPEGDNNDNVVINADEIQDEEEESINETEDEVAMIEEEVNPSSEVDRDPKVKTTRSGSISRRPTKLTMAQHHLHTQAHSLEEYTTENSKVIAMTMCYINEMSLNKKNFLRSIIQLNKRCQEIWPEKKGSRIY